MIKIAFATALDVPSFPRPARLPDVAQILAVNELLCVRIEARDARVRVTLRPKKAA